MYDILFTSDYTKVGAENFCLDNQNLAADNIPGSYGAKHLCLDDYMAGTTRLRMNHMPCSWTSKVELDGPLGNKGKSIVNYRGHGGIQTWGDHLVDIGINTPPYFWYNFTRPSVAISADCLDGNFSFSDMMLQLPSIMTGRHWAKRFGCEWTGNGRTLVISGLGYNGEHTILHEGFYKGMFEQHLHGRW